MRTLAQNSNWVLPPELPPLQRGEVHVWKSAVDVSAECYASLYHICSADERERAARFRFQRDSVRFIAARGTLRSMLARYVGIAPALLRFAYDEFGKPSLLDTQATSTLNFNLSHSGSWAVVAFARDHALGVDVELIRPEFAHDDIAEQFFSRSESLAIRRASASARTRAFFNCWTRKEAFVKAKGKGLSFDLKQFDVSLLPDELPRLLSTAYDSSDRRRWSIHAFEIERDYVGAVVAPRTVKFIQYFQWQTGDIHEREQRRQPHLQSCSESRRTVLDLAGGQRDSARLERHWQAGH